MDAELSRAGVSVRDLVIDCVQLLASAQEQLAYSRDVPLADVPAELVQLGEDLFRPKDPAYTAAFSDEELRDLAHLYGLVREAAEHAPASVRDLLKRPAWRRVLTVAADLSARLTRRG